MIMSEKALLNNKLRNRITQLEYKGLSGRKGSRSE